jgi:SAM-dependent methyltransferase
VIEHFRNPGEALTEIHRLLRPGGVLAFSTPSFSGISGRKSPLKFLENSPEDHWTIWDPRRLPRILERFGFEVKKIAVTGHHPERFPLGACRKGKNMLNARFLGWNGLKPDKLLAGKYLKRSPLYRLFSGVSRVLGWGDTFEAYAVKKDK